VVRPADRKLQLLQSNAVLYANQPISLAVADTLEAAQEAAALICVTDARRPYSVSLERGLPRAYKPEKGDGAACYHRRLEWTQQAHFIRCTQGIFGDWERVATLLGFAA
jgi:hypothetical protein